MSKREHLQYDGDEVLVTVDASGARLKVLPGTDFEVDGETAEILRSAPGISTFSERRASTATAMSSTASSTPTDK